MSGDLQLRLEDVVRYAGASGDFNPIHYDLEAARGAGFDRLIVMGMLSAGLMFADALRSPDLDQEAASPADGNVTFGVRFRRPLLVGDQVRTSSECSDGRRATWLGTDAEPRAVEGHVDSTADLAMPQWQPVADSTPYPFTVEAGAARAFGLATGLPAGFVGAGRVAPSFVVSTWRSNPEGNPVDHVQLDKARMLQTGWQVSYVGGLLRCGEVLTVCDQASPTRTLDTRAGPAVSAETVTVGRDSGGHIRFLSVQSFLEPPRPTKGRS